MKKLAVIALLAASAAPAFAGDLYVVGSVGQSRFSGHKSDIDNELVAAGVTGLSSSLDKTDTAYKALVGYQFTPNIAVEGGYVDLGKAKYKATFTGGSGNADVKASGVVISAVGILPINDAISAFAKVGAIDAKVKVNASATGPGGSASGSADSTDWKATWGLGATYNFNKQVGVRVEYEQFNDLGSENKTGKGDVSLWSAGVVVKF